MREIVYKNGDLFSYSLWAKLCYHLSKVNEMFFLKKALLPFEIMKLFYPVVISK